MATRYTTLYQINVQCGKMTTKPIANRLVPFFRAARVMRYMRAKGVFCYISPVKVNAYSASGMRR